MIAGMVLMTAGMVHVTNLTPGSEWQPSSLAAAYTKAWANKSRELSALWQGLLNQVESSLTHGLKGAQCPPVSL
jgi:hypothetical protein